MFFINPLVVIILSKKNLCSEFPMKEAKNMFIIIRQAQSVTVVILKHIMRIISGPQFHRHFPTLAIIVRHF
jgi:hypothetical protein